MHVSKVKTYRNNRRRQLEKKAERKKGVERQRGEKRNGILKVKGEVKEDEGGNARGGSSTSWSRIERNSRQARRPG